MGQQSQRRNAADQNSSRFKPLLSKQRVIALFFIIFVVKVVVSNSEEGMSEPIQTIAKSTPALNQNSVDANPTAQKIKPEAGARPVVFSNGELCKATVSALFSRPAKIISVYRKNGNEIRVKYTRKDDKSIWKNKCMLEDGIIVWGSVDPDRIGDENGGRWRTRYSEGDDKITYKIQNYKLYLTVENELTGSSDTHTFTKGDFR